MKIFFDDNNLKEINWEFVSSLSVLTLAVIGVALIFSGAMSGVGALAMLFSMLLIK